MLIQQHVPTEIQSFYQGLSWESRVALKAVADLETARSRLGQLASANPGEYFVFDLTAKHVLVSLVSSDEEIRAIRD